MRLWMPDRPGALGQVASRIGAVRGDVLDIAVLERGHGSVVDELVVQLDSAALIDLMVSEVNAVDGVSVEHVRPLDGDRVDPDLSALAVAVELASAEAHDRLQVLCDGVLKVSDAVWAAVIGGAGLICAAGDRPDEGWLTAFVDGTRHLDDAAQQIAGDVVWARLERTGATIAAGRSDRPVHDRERSRVLYLAQLADALSVSGNPVV